MPIAPSTHYWHIVNGKRYESPASEYESLATYREAIRKAYGSLRGVISGEIIKEV